jgi:(S)-ureidoglycine aminohydrolase
MMEDNLYKLGHTRTVRRPDHLLLTQDTFVRSPLPGLRNGIAIVHVSSAVGARFTEMTIEFGQNGVLDAGPSQRFVYVLEGELFISGERLTAGEYAYMPAGGNRSVSAHGPARAEVFDKPYQQLAGVGAPEFFTGREGGVKPEAIDDAPGIEVRHLLPEAPQFDFAVNTMTYEPGAALPMVESHIMEHGLLMLAGGGIYRLGESWYPVKAGDFIWMAPYCAQWFGALGKDPARYLIYKDWNRHPQE